MRELKVRETYCCRLAGKSSRQRYF
ncbi:hypothetical protein E2C01_101185 [Portunus trituberculatus]|uniref:Uncharacterized protein n=1 Tax=Portunus trituberculatus TaxID=210409 RepID=A0A5B7KE38_PORTR|nr:hypothetical protein [Portunus trituberculatus]